MRVLHKVPFLLIPFMLSACLDSSDSTSSSTPPPAVTTYSVGGATTGLSSAGLALQNNSTDNLMVNAGATTFTFLTQLADSASYNVSVNSNPTGLSCSVNNGSGTIASANVTNVQINCVPKHDLVSRSSDDSVIADGSFMSFHAMSSDGRFVAFESAMTGLASGSTDVYRQIFVRDRQLNTTTLVSRASGIDGAEGNNSSYEPSISADGRFVVYESYATNLVAGDTAGRVDVFMRDMQSNTTTRLSVGLAATEANGSSWQASISADGNYVAFRSDATNLVSGSHGALYLLARQSGTITPIDLDTGGTAPSGGSNHPVLSADGSRIAFWSYANDLVAGDTNGAWDIFVYDRTAGTTTLASVASDGTQKNQGSESVSRIVRPAISGDGNVVAFATTATNLVAGDTNGLQDVFVRNLTSGITTRASVDSAGGQGNADSPIGQGERVALSNDGTWVVFSTVATNLAAGATSGQSVMIHNNTTHATSTITNSPSWSAGAYGPTISADGRYVGFLSDEYLDPRFPSNSGFYVQDRNIQ